MKTYDAIKYFKTQAALARALQIKAPSIADWGDDVPDLRQLQLEAVTNGGLKADARLKLPPMEARAAE